MQANSSDKYLKTQPDHTFIGFTCKIAASIGSSAQNHSVQSKVEEIMHSVNTEPFNDQTNLKHKNIEKLNQQLESIDKLRTQYESRNDYRMKTINTQNSQKSRSLEKHILKPSQTPLFARKFQTHRKQIDDSKPRESQQSFKNLFNQVKMESHNDFSIIQQQLSKQNAELSKSLKQKDLELANQAQLIDHLNQTVKDLKKQKEQVLLAFESNSSNAEEGKRIKLELQKVKLEKQQLQTILKELLYQREKQRLFQPKQKQNNLKSINSSNSAVTSGRKSFTPGKCGLFRPSPRQQNSGCNNLIEKTITINKLSNRQKPVPRPVLEQIAVEQQSKKMKVQNILDKLKIKINKN